eukprot:540585_1
MSKYVKLSSYPGNNYFYAPTGMDKDNYVVVEYNRVSSGSTQQHCGAINCVHKYNIYHDTWTTMYTSDDFGSASGSLGIGAACINAKKQIIHSFSKNRLIKIQLNGEKITNEFMENIPNIDRSSNSIVYNNSLFIIGGFHNNSVLKYDLENGQLSKIAIMYEKVIEMGFFGLINDSNTNCLLLFGGLGDGKYLDSILEFNLKTKEWNKLSVTLPKKLMSVHCTMAIRNKYVLIFGGRGEF